MPPGDGKIRAKNRTGKQANNTDLRPLRSKEASFKDAERAHEEQKAVHAGT